MIREITICPSSKSPFALPSMQLFIHNGEGSRQTGKNSTKGPSQHRPGQTALRRSCSRCVFGNSGTVYGFCFSLILKAP
ncbi:hypothetical protein I7I48_00286 [Histoplasma ohiense]|nr:hypothetical protein I7I48_00286 [Histoplasma ohiense (nom. inval.)]